MSQLPALVLEGVRQYPDALRAKSVQEALQSMGQTGAAIRGGGWSDTEIACMLRHVKGLQKIAVPGRPEFTTTVPPSIAAKQRPGVRSRTTPTRVAITQLIRHASKSVTVVAPFCHPKVLPDLASSLESASQNGANIHIVIQASKTWSVEPFVQKILKHIPSAKATVVSSKEATMHAKVIIVDHNAAHIGSANLTPHGYGRNFEAGVITKGSHVRRLESSLSEYLAQVSKHVYTSGNPP